MTLRCGPAETERLRAGTEQLRAQVEQLHAQVEQLRRALVHREAIGLAKGVVMARSRCDAEQAFELLRLLSNRHNQRVAVLAEAIGAVVAGRPGRTTPELVAVVRDFLAALPTAGGGEPPAPVSRPSS